MTPEERTTKLDAIREDRLARGGLPPPADPSAVWREILASQRLAGVDVAGLYAFIVVFEQPCPPGVDLSAFWWAMTDEEQQQAEQEIARLERVAAGARKRRRRRRAFRTLQEAAVVGTWGALVVYLTDMPWWWALSLVVLGTWLGNRAAAWKTRKR